MSHSILDDALDRELAPAWRPEPGNKLVRTVTDASERERYDGDAYPIVTVRTDNGEFAVHAFHTVLQNELARIRPTIGDAIGIRYEGQKATANGRSKYHSYRVRSTGASAGVNWARYGDGPDDPVEPIERREAAATTRPSGADLAERFGDTMPSWEEGE